METKTQDTEERFVESNHLGEFYKQAKMVDTKLWATIQAVREHYVEYSKNCESIAQRIVLDILGEEAPEGIHSVRFRIKNIDSLLSKIVRKKAFLSKDIQEDYNIEKYRDLDGENYYKIITDISGIRILIRYREQWQQVHEWLWGKYYQGDEYYLKNFIQDYKSNPGKPFIAEKPKVFYRNDGDRIFYVQMGRDVFDFEKSSEGYNSIHYLINTDGKYIEIQLRTILDEAWSECTHDIVYKSTDKDQIEELEYLSQCLSQQTIAAETITNLIYEKVNKNGWIYRNVRKMDSDMDEIAVQAPKERENSVEKRMHLLEKHSVKKPFNGDINSLL